MNYLVFKCANGIVIFEWTRLGLGQGIQAHCWTDGTDLFSNPQGTFNPQAGLEALITKATALKGAVQSAVSVTIP
jgi:hypothetical protein